MIKYREIHGQFVLTYRIKLLLPSFLGGGLLIYSFIIALGIVGFRFANTASAVSLQEADATIAIANLSLALVTSAAGWAILVRQAFLQRQGNRRLSFYAALPANDREIAREELLKPTLGFAAWFGTIALMVYGFIGWALKFGILDWLLLIAIVVAVIAALCGLIVLLAITMARWLHFGVLILIALGGFVFLLQLLNDSRGARDGAVRVIDLLAIAPTTWPNRAFQSVLLDRQLVGFLWLVPIPAVVWLANRSLGKDLQIVEYDSRRCGLERPLFSPSSPLHNVAIPVAPRGIEAKLFSEEIALPPTINRASATAIMRRELDAVGRLGCLRWPIPMLSRLLTPREQVFADLAQPWLQSWRVPWLLAILGQLGAGVLLWFITPDAQIPNKSMLSLILSLCVMGVILIRVILRSHGSTFGAMPRLIFQLPFSGREWYRSQTVLTAGIAVLLMLPVSGLLTALHVVWLHTQLSTLLIQMIVGIVIVAAYPLGATCCRLLAATNFCNEYPFRWFAGFIGGYAIALGAFGLVVQSTVWSLISAGVLSVALVAAGIFASTQMFYHCDTDIIR